MSAVLAMNNVYCREVNMIAMRLGPGKHLKGRKLMGGIVEPEKFDYFHEVRHHSHPLFPPLQILI